MNAEAWIAIVVFCATQIGVLVGQFLTTRVRIKVLEVRIDSVEKQLDAAMLQDRELASEMKSLVTELARLTGLTQRDV